MGGIVAVGIGVSVGVAVGRGVGVSTTRATVVTVAVGAGWVAVASASAAGFSSLGRIRMPATTMAASKTSETVAMIGQIDLDLAVGSATPPGGVCP
ncbi:MAG: hypothetical protein JXA89_23070 [Anaerolineae bacterium]|nr:hypothetical protein [Anaerolineae bacterium]